MIDIAIGSVIGSLVSILGLYALAKLMQKTGFFEDMLIEFALKAADNKDLQASLYQIGGMVGSGAKQGFGLTQKGGKMKIEDIVLQLGLGWAQSKGLIPSFGDQGQPQALPQQLEPQKRREQIGL